MGEISTRDVNRGAHNTGGVVPLRSLGRSEDTPFGSLQLSDNHLVLLLKTY